MKKIVIVSLFLSLSSLIHAQRTCKFHTLLQEELKRNTQLSIQKNNFEYQLPLFMEQLSKREIRLPDTIFIPLVFHVLWYSDIENIVDSQITTQIRVLNEDFRSINEDTSNTPDFFKKNRGKTKFYFVLAKQDPYGMPTTGINRVFTNRADGFSLDGSVNVSKLGGQDAWNPQYYVNIWVCNMESASGTVGATYFPGGSLKRDGIMVDYRYLGTGGVTEAPYNLGRTMTHEMGHYFNLDHTWGPTDITFAPFCGDDDHVEDTPPQANANYYCPKYPRPSCGNISDMYMNYMDYVDDPCMNMFSKGQVERMMAAWYIMTPYLSKSKALETPVPLSAADAGVIEILNPTNNSFTCNDADKIIVVIRNFGTDTLKNVKIITGIQENPAANAVYNLTDLDIPPQSNDTIRLEGLFKYNIEGSLPFFAATKQPNHLEDGNDKNNKTIIVINVQGNRGLKLPYIQHFNQIPFPPTGVGIDNPDKLFTWTATNGSQLSGFAPSVMMDNIEYPFIGRKDYLLMPSVDLSTTKKPVLSFFHAYQLYKEGKRLHSDTLTVEVSTDCGQSWHQIFYKGGFDLASVQPPQRGYFSPDKKDQWKKNSLSLTAWRGIKNVWIRFGNICGGENLLYLDDIMIEDVQPTTRVVVENGVVE